MRFIFICLLVHILIIKGAVSLPQKGSGSKNSIKDVFSEDRTRLLIKLVEMMPHRWGSVPFPTRLIYARSFCTIQGSTRFLLSLSCATRNGSRSQTSSWFTSAAQTTARVSCSRWVSPDIESKLRKLHQSKLFKSIFKS